MLGLKARTIIAWPMYLDGMSRYTFILLGADADQTLVLTHPVELIKDHREIGKKNDRIRQLETETSKLKKHFLF